MILLATIELKLLQIIPCDNEELVRLMLQESKEFKAGTNTKLPESAIAITPVISKEDERSESIRSVSPARLIALHGVRSENAEKFTSDSSVGKSIEPIVDVDVTGYRA